MSQRTLSLVKLLAGLQIMSVQGEIERMKVRGITSDSREVAPGFLFVAIKGTRIDRHQFISEVYEKGAVAVVGEKDLNFGGKVYIQVPNSRAAFAKLCSAWYGHPSQKLTTVGVTGTDGKTTTVNLIRSILKGASIRVGSVSTVDAVIGNKHLDTGLHTTTPDPAQLQELLAKMVNEGLQFAIIEATSHGLVQDRLAGIQFDTAVLTNLTHEHLDYHGSFEDYRAAKGLLFRGARYSVLNVSDPNCDYFQQVSTGQIFTYGFERKGDVIGENLTLGPNGLQFDCYARLPYGDFNLTVTSSLCGRFNAQNILAAIAVGFLYHIQPQIIQSAVAKFRSLPGRMELIDEGQNFTVIVDFAHTPNSLEQVLIYLREILPEASRLICIFGCAGERDQQKRPMMGEIAARLADFTILTAEDPRAESLHEILEQIATGCRRTGAVEGDSFIRISDRAQAVTFAIEELAKLNDVVVICGKGHEKSMCFGETEIPWSDQEVARVALQRRKSKNS